MNNETQSLPAELCEALSSQPVKTATFEADGRFYTYAPDMGFAEFLKTFPEHRRLSGMLDSSGSSWASGAFCFYVADCFDPPLYVQFGDSWEDAYESFCDNEPSLEIPESDFADYGLPGDDATCQFTSDGRPIDTDNVQGITSPLRLVAVTF